jgi:ribosomal protein S12 methylthiotransferase accessory factor
MERDAFLVTWMNRLPAAEIDLPTAGPAMAAITAHFARRGVGLRAFLLPSDLPASIVLAVSFDDDPDRPAQVVGLGCHLDPATAALKAVLELVAGRRVGRSRAHPSRPGRYDDVVTLEDHAAFAAQPERRPEFAFLWSSGRHISLADRSHPADGDAAAQLDHCVAALATAGLRAIAVDLTLPDIRECGLVVVRVFVPGLQPMHFGAGAERRGGTRLFELPMTLGLADRPRSEADLNPCPHPLA